MCVPVRLTVRAGLYCGSSKRNPNSARSSYELCVDYELAHPVSNITNFSESGMVGRSEPALLASSNLYFLLHVHVSHVLRNVLDNTLGILRAFTMEAQLLFWATSNDLTTSEHNLWYFNVGWVIWEVGGPLRWQTHFLTFKFLIIIWCSFFPLLLSCSNIHTNMMGPIRYVKDKYDGTH